MATIYPTPLPRCIEDDPMRAAERRVYEALRDGLGQEFSVFYGVAWLAATPGTGARDGEVDFVVAHPDMGVLLLEVKGGAISRDGTTGHWTSVDHAGYPHPIHDPFAQVRASKHALLEKLKEHPTLRQSWIPMGHGVVLPDSARPDGPLAPDAPPEITRLRRGHGPHRRVRGGDVRLLEPPARISAAPGAGLPSRPHRAARAEFRAAAAARNGSRR